MNTMRVMGLSGHFTMKFKKKILIDGYYLGDSERGMAKFTKNVFNDFVLNGATIIVSDIKLKKAYENTIYFPRIPYPFWEQILLPILIAIMKFDVLVSPFNTTPLFFFRSCKRVVVIHDVIFMDLRSLLRKWTKTQLFGQIYRFVILTLVMKKIDLICTVSYHSSRQIRDVFRKNIRCYIKTIYNLPSIYKSVSNEVQSNQEVKLKKFIFTVSGTSYNKNLDNLISGFLNSDSAKVYHLLIAGIKKSEAEQVRNVFKDHRYAARVLLLDYVSNDDIWELHNSCELFISASLDEGFGIPLIDSLRAKKLIACSDIAVYRELAGDNVHYFGPDKAENIIEILNSFNHKKLKNNNKFDYEKFESKVKEQLSSLTGAINAL